MSSMSPLRYFVVTCAMSASRFPIAEQSGLLSRSADRNSIHIYSEFPRTIRPTPQYPYTHLLREEHAANIQVHAFRRGKARPL